MALALLLSLVSIPAAEAQADRTLRLFPSPVVMAPGESVAVSAWLCRTLDGGDVFGADGVPGTDDDRCEAAKKSTWSTEDPKIAQVKPKKGASVDVTGRKDGVSTLEARFQASSTRSFVSRTTIDVFEPLADPEPAVDGQPDPGAEPGEDARPVPGVDVSVIVHPGFAILAPGDRQLFVAYQCPLLGAADPRGPDMMPGTSDDFCKDADATWSLLGDPPIGTLAPTQGFFTVLDTEADPDETALMASIGGTIRVAQSTTEGSSGVISAIVGDQAGGASALIDPAAVPVDRAIPGDADNDGDVDIDDLDRWQRAYGATSGGDGFDPAADFDQNGEVNGLDFPIWQANHGRR